MSVHLTPIGFGNVIAINRVIAIASPNSLPVRRMVKEMKDTGLMIDMTSGRKVKAVIFSDDGHIILAAVTPLTIAGRVATEQEEAAKAEAAS